MFGFFISYSLHSSESLEGLGKLKSYDISIVWIQLLHSIFGVWILWSVYKFSSRLLPQRLENLLPFNSRSCGYSWRKLLLFGLFQFPSPCSLALVTLILEGIVLLLPFSFIYLWCSRDCPFLFSFYLFLEILWPCYGTLYFKYHRFCIQTRALLLYTLVFSSIIFFVSRPAPDARRTFNKILLSIEFTFGSYCTIYCTCTIVPCRPPYNCTWKLLYCTIYHIRYSTVYHIIYSTVYSTRISYCTLYHISYCTVT